VEKPTFVGFSILVLRRIDVLRLWAQELVDNHWNFYIIDPALAGLAAQGLLVAIAALSRLRLP
jgi:hypothetical protein